jgi:hypothetical protein
MFCSNCGKAEQTPDSYCRNCGQFLHDLSGKSYLINKILGASNPETQVNVNLTINVITTLTSVMLLGFLNGYYDSLSARTGQGAPPVIYFVYVFLGLVAAWQTLGFLVNLRLKRKLGKRKQDPSHVAPSADKGAVPSGQTQKSLPQADFDNIVQPSVTETTTRTLNKVARK